MRYVQRGLDGLIPGCVQPGASPSGARQAFTLLDKSLFCLDIYLIPLYLDV